MPKLRNQNQCERNRLAGERKSERIGRLSPEEKVNMAIDMTDAMVHVCVEGMRAQDPNMTREEAIKKLRERFEWAKRGSKQAGRVE